MHEPITMHVLLHTKQFIVTLSSPLQTIWVVRALHPNPITII